MRESYSWSSGWSSFHRGHQMVVDEKPPSTTRFCPVTKDEAAAGLNHAFQVVEISTDAGVKGYSFAGPGANQLPAIRQLLVGGDLHAIEVHLDTQAEVDLLWHALMQGGQAQRCGWLVDRFGVSWQIVPRSLIRLMLTTDDATATRVTQAMMGMVKLDIAALEAAARG